MAYNVACYYIQNCLGVGTDTPSETFHVNGTSQFDDGLNMTRGKISWGGSPSRFIVTSCGGYNMVLATDNFVDRMTIQASTGNVGIGTSSPSELLTIAGGGKIAAFKSDNTRRGVFYTNNDGTVVESDVTGNDPLFLSSPGASGTVRIQTGGTTRMSVGTNIGVGTTSPAGRFHINHTSSEGACVLILQSTNSCGNGTISWRSCAGVTQGQIGSNYNIGDSAGNLELITSGNTRLLVTSGGNIGMGTLSPSYRLHVNGTFYAAGSSQDYKEDICQYNTDSCLFMCLKPKAYQYKEEWKHLGKDLKSGTQIGLIAEEVAESHPELAVLVNEEDNQVVRNVDYEKLSIILLAEVQKLRQEVDQLNQK
jgi:hypothetical protein